MELFFSGLHQAKILKYSIKKSHIHYKFYNVMNFLYCEFQHEKKMTMFTICIHLKHKSEALPVWTLFLCQFRWENNFPHNIFQTLLPISSCEETSFIIWTIRVHHYRFSDMYNGWMVGTKWNQILKPSCSCNSHLNITESFMGCLTNGTLSTCVGLIN